MGQKVTTFKFSAIYPIKYRFKCEHCGFSSGWLPYAFSHEEQAHGGGWNARLTPEEEKELNSKTSIGLEEKVRNAKNAAQKHKYPFSDICPICNKHQSWGNNTLYGYIFSVPVCVCVLVTALLWLTSSLDKGFALWTVIITTTASLIVTLAYVLRRRKQTSGVAQKHLPEIDWSRQ